MQRNMNYQKKLEQELEKIKDESRIPKLFLHSCCAPCSSYVLEYLSDYFCITIYYYNPNITLQEEYEKRLGEQMRLINQLPVKYPVSLLEGNYNPQDFFDIAKGMEELKEGEQRCYQCYQFRLSDTAKKAKELGFDYFATTLSVSPYKNAEWINAIGERLGAEYGVSYLYADFKKKNGYQRSIELSKQYNLYRQEYCGCKKPPCQN